MTISTSLFFSRAVTLMSKNQTDLAAMQEKVATGKELVRPSDGVDKALNISRLRSGIEQLQAYENSLNLIGDRLKIEESFLQGTSDTLTEIKTLVIQGANGSYNSSDRQVIGRQIEELIDEIKNLANGADVNGNYVFSGTRVKTAPYQEDEAGVIRYQGDQVETNVKFTNTRTSGIGRSGPDIYQSIFTGQNINVSEGIYQVEVGSSIDAGDEFTLSLDEHEFSYTAEAGDNRNRVAEHFYEEITKKIEAGEIDNVSAVLDGEIITLTSLDGANRAVSGSAKNALGGMTDTQSFVVTELQAPDIGRPEKVEFFEALQSVARVMRTGTQDEIQDRIAYLDQMIDQSTLGLADIGIERSTIEAELGLNQDLRATIQANLSREEDLDYAAAITQLQAKMMALEAAQSSFAKISNLSIFNYLR